MHAAYLLLLMRLGPTEVAAGGPLCLESAGYFIPGAIFAAAFIPGGVSAGHFIPGAIAAGACHE